MSILMDVYVEVFFLLFYLNKTKIVVLTEADISNEIVKTVYQWNLNTE